MRLPGSEKLEIIRLVEQSHLPARRTCRVCTNNRHLRQAASYDDVKFELNDAIIKRGLVVDHIGQIGTMLDRTGPDVGSTKPLYTRAEFFTFCSAK
jgi:hypothetical protein